MALILNIDTAVESGSVSISQDEHVVGHRSHVFQKDHASWIHTAIREMIQDAGCEINQLQAVAVSNGPGSYTGLRIGMSVAKGLCYTLNIPLITIGTLEIMAEAALKQLPEDLKRETNWICPMIDARRMEVYFAIYDCHGFVIQEPTAAIVDPQSFLTHLDKKRMIFLGNGSDKLKNILHHPHALFMTFDLQNTAKYMVDLSYNYWKREKFSPLALADPLYIKDFYSPQRKDS